MFNQEGENELLYPAAKLINKTAGKVNLSESTVVLQPYYSVLVTLLHAYKSFFRIKEALKRCTLLSNFCTCSG